MVQCFAESITLGGSFDSQTKQVTKSLFYCMLKRFATEIFFFGLDYVHRATSKSWSEGELQELHVPANVTCKVRPNRLAFEVLCLASYSQYFCHAMNSPHRQQSFRFRKPLDGGAWKTQEVVTQYNIPEPDVAEPATVYNTVIYSPLRASVAEGRPTPPIPSRFLDDTTPKILQKYVFENNNNCSSFATNFQIRISCCLRCCPTVCGVLSE